MPRVQFLGTGNAFSPHGRMHALILIDGHTLVDTPPTLLPQLRRVGVSTKQIENLLFTHWHADHMFGFPFLILERRYIANAEKPLNVYLRPRGREILSNLSHVGFPKSLDEALSDDINWIESESGEIENSDWTFERFQVVHTPETDPHGYMLSHKSGFKLLHCGDSGTCQEIEERAAYADVILIEMGVPDFVESPNHHNPSQVNSLSQRHPHATILVTHNYADANDQEGGFSMPTLNEGIVQLEDGDELQIDENGGHILVRK
ncbi:MAG: MBL fold metallo-hydrolase [Candidatus Poseidoniales archaeon]|nr:MBL fold metallo-hydrolase [Candidatus Poseidoniales archaeon]